MAYWHDLVTQKSWTVLTQLKSFQFTLIGGWAVFLYTQTLKSKDIDLIVDYDELGQLQQKLDVTKNERLKKYEAKIEEVDIDIYTPHYSNPGVAAEVVLKQTNTIDNFTVARLEVLLVLKQHAFSQRMGSAKGEKDRLDIASLLRVNTFDWAYYKAFAAKHRPESPSELKEVINSLHQMTELNINSHSLAHLKKQWLKFL